MYVTGLFSTRSNRKTLVSWCVLTYSAVACIMLFCFQDFPVSTGWIAEFYCVLCFLVVRFTVVSFSVLYFNIVRVTGCFSTAHISEWAVLFFCKICFDLVFVLLIFSVPTIRRYQRSSVLYYVRFCTVMSYSAISCSLFWWTDVKAYVKNVLFYAVLSCTM